MTCYRTTFSYNSDNGPITTVIGHGIASNESTIIRKAQCYADIDQVWALKQLGFVVKVPYGHFHDDQIGQPFTYTVMDYKYV